MSCSYDCDPCLPYSICKKRGTYQISLAVTVTPSSYDTTGQNLTIASTVRNTGSLCLEGSVKICNNLLGTECYDCISIAPCCSRTFTQTYTTTSANVLVPTLTLTSTAVFTISCKKAIRTCTVTTDIPNSDFSLTGATGPTGATGAMGTTGATGPTGGISSSFMFAHSSNTILSPSSSIVYNLDTVFPEGSFYLDGNDIVAATGVNGYYRLDYLENQYMTITSFTLAVTGTSPVAGVPTITQYDLYGNIPFSTVVYLTGGQNGLPVGRLSVTNHSDSTASLQGYVNGAWTGYLVLQQIGSVDVPLP